MEVNRSRRILREDGFAIREYSEPRITGRWTEIAGGIAVTVPLGTDIRERSLVMTVPGGCPVITGCAHPHISRIVERVARVGPAWGVTGEDIDALAGAAYLPASH